MIGLITRLLPVWAVLLSAVAMAWPDRFTALGGWIVPLLAGVMFCMGMTLTWDDFRSVFRRPVDVGLAALLQYTVMPLAGWGLAVVLGLEPALIAGMVLLGSTSGGTASNVITYLARGNVALSITCTLVSTLLAVVMLPLLSWFYLRQVVPVDVLGMVRSVAQIVLLPVLLGTAINSVAARRITPIKPLLPLLSVVVIVLIIAVIAALNAQRLRQVGGWLLLAVMLHNGFGLAMGYLLPRLLGRDEVTCRTLAIEVGMQNSGLAVALALKHFSPLAALPGAIFSVWHNISGSIAAAVWSRNAGAPPVSSGKGR